MSSYSVFIDAVDPVVPLEEGPMHVNFRVANGSENYLYGYVDGVMTNSAGELVARTDAVQMGVEAHQEGSGSLYIAQCPIAGVGYSLTVVLRGDPTMVKIGIPSIAAQDPAMTKLDLGSFSMKALARAGEAVSRGNEPFASVSQLLDVAASYLFRINQFEVVETRAPTNDTDFVYLYLSVGEEVDGSMDPIEAARGIKERIKQELPSENASIDPKQGIRGEHFFALQLNEDVQEGDVVRLDTLPEPATIGPVNLVPGSTKVTLFFSILNHGHNQEQAAQTKFFFDYLSSAGAVAATIILGAQTASLWLTMNELHQQLHAIFATGCDGVVALDAFFETSAGLAGRTSGLASYSETREYPMPDLFLLALSDEEIAKQKALYAPNTIACSTSKYKVTFAIERLNNRAIA